MELVEGSAGVSFMDDCSSRSVDLNVVAWLWPGLWTCGYVVVVSRLVEKCCSLSGCVAVGCSGVSSMRL